MILSTTDDQRDLPRYFAQVWAVARQVRRGRLDIVLPDLGRKATRAEIERAMQGHILAEAVLMGTYIKHKGS